MKLSSLLHSWIAGFAWGCSPVVTVQSENLVVWLYMKQTFVKHLFYSSLSLKCFSSIVSINPYFSCMRWTLFLMAFGDEEMEACLKFQSYWLVEREDIQVLLESRIHTYNCYVANTLPFPPKSGVHRQVHSQRSKVVEWKLSSPAILFHYIYELRMLQHETLLAIHLTEINIRQKDMKT